MGFDEFLRLHEHAAGAAAGIVDAAFVGAGVSAGKCCSRSPKPTDRKLSSAALSRTLPPIIPGSITFSSAVSSGSKK